MQKSGLKKRIEFLSSLPKRRLKDMSIIDGLSDEKIHYICEACFNVVEKKIPLEKKKENQLKRKLLPIHKELRQLANPSLKLKTKRRILRKQQVGAGFFTTLASILIPTLLSLLNKK